MNQKNLKLLSRSIPEFNSPAQLKYTMIKETILQEKERSFLLIQAVR
jgi:hypothetical protein